MNKSIHNEVQKLINDNYKYFDSFSKIIIYYDNGQEIVSRALKDTFESEFNNVERRKVKPKEYKLLQVADLFCTITLLELKRQKYHFSSSENAIFSVNTFKKHYLSTMKSKKNIIIILLYFFKNISFTLICFFMIIFLAHYAISK